LPLAPYGKLEALYSNTELDLEATRAGVYQSFTNLETRNMRLAYYASLMARAKKHNFENYLEEDKIDFEAIFKIKKDTQGTPTSKYQKGVNYGR
jgi:hypothetical protein